MCVDGYFAAILLDRHTRGWIKLKLYPLFFVFPTKICSITSWQMDEITTLGLQTSQGGWQEMTCIVHGTIHKTYDGYERQTCVASNGQPSVTSTTNALLFSKENGVVLQSFLPHSSLTLQPNPQTSQFMHVPRSSWTAPATNRSELVLEKLSQSTLLSSTHSQHRIHNVWNFRYRITAV